MQMETVRWVNDVKLVALCLDKGVVDEDTRGLGVGDAVGQLDILRRSHCQGCLYFSMPISNLTK